MSVGMVFCIKNRILIRMTEAIPMLLSFFCCFLFVHCPLFVSAQSITLDDAINRYIYQTRYVQEAQLTYTNERLQYSNYQKSYLPSFSIFLSPAGYNHSMRLLQNYLSGEYYNIDEFSNSSNGSISISQKIAPTGGVLGVRSSLNYLSEFANNKTSFSSSPLYISYSQSLLGGRKNYRYERQIHQARYEMAQKRYCSSVSQEQQQVVSLYLEAYTAMMDTVYYSRKASIGDTLVSQANVKHQMGKITDYDYRCIELEQIETKIQRLKAINAYHDAVQQLANRLNVEPEHVFLSALDPHTLPQMMEEEYIMELVHKNNPEWQSMHVQCLSAEANLFQAELATRFNADISVGYGLNQYGYTLQEAYNHPDRQQSISMTLSIPVFQWGINRNKRAIARNEYALAQLEQEEQLKDYQYEVHSTVSDFNLYIKMMDLNQQKYELSGIQYYQTALRYNSGKASLAELQVADKNYIEAKQSYVSMVRTLFTRYYKIRHLTLFDFLRQKDLSELILCNYGIYE